MLSVFSMTCNVFVFQSEENALVEVTGDKVSQLGLVFEEECQSSFTSQRISAYTSDKNLTDRVSGEERRHGSDVARHTCPSQSNSHVSSGTGRAEGNETFVHFNTEECTVKPKQFIRPFAPLNTRNNFLHNSLLKSRQDGLNLPPKGIINEIHFKSDQKSVSSDDSSEGRFHTCPDQSLSSSSGDSDDPSIKGTRRKPEYSDTCDISKELSKLILLTGQRFMVSEDKHVAYVTLDLEEPSLSHFSFSNCKERPKTDNMPHKTSKTFSDGKTRSKHKEKPAEKQQHEIQTSKKQDLLPPSQMKEEFNSEGDACEDRPVTAIETIVITEKIAPKPQGKKKKKHAQHGTTKSENDPPSDIGSKSIQNSMSGKPGNFDVKVALNGLDKPASHLPTKVDVTKKDSSQKVMSVRPKVAPSGSFGAKMGPGSVNATSIKLKVDASNTAKMENKTCTSDFPSSCLSSMLNDDIKRRRIAVDLSGAVPLRTRPQLPAIFRQTRKEGEDTIRRAYSEVVKQTTPIPKEGSPNLFYLELRSQSIRGCPILLPEAQRRAEFSFNLPKTHLSGSSLGLDYLVQVCLTKLCSVVGFGNRIGHPCTGTIPWVRNVRTIQLDPIWCGLLVLAYLDLVNVVLTGLPIG